MATLIIDPPLEERLIAERVAMGADHHDEVWEGVYVMAPIPNDQHQELVGEMYWALQDAIGRRGHGKVRPGVNLSPLNVEDWKHDFRVPDVAVFLPESKAEYHDSHWRGPADFLVEIVSPQDRSYEKLPFFSRLGVRELLIVDRNPWKLELYRHDQTELRLAGRSTVDGGEVLRSEILPLAFRLVAGEGRPRIEVTGRNAGREWLI